MVDVQVGLDQVRIRQDHHAQFRGAEHLQGTGEPQPAVEADGDVVGIRELPGLVIAEPDPGEVLVRAGRQQDVAQARDVLMARHPRLHAVRRVVVAEEGHVESVGPGVGQPHRALEIARRRGDPLVDHVTLGPDLR